MRELQYVEIKVGNFNMLDRNAIKNHNAILSVFVDGKEN